MRDVVRHFDVFVVRPRELVLINPTCHWHARFLHRLRDTLPSFLAPNWLKLLPWPAKAFLLRTRHMSASAIPTGATDDVFANDALHSQAVLQSPLPPRCIVSRKTRLDTGRQSAIVRSKAVLQSREARAEEDEAYLTFRMEMFAGAAPEDAVAKLARAYSLTCPEMALRLLGPARLGGAVPDATGESTMMGIAVEALMRVAEGRPALRAHGHPALVKRRPSRDSSSPGPSAKRSTLVPLAPRVGGPGEEAPRDEDREEGFPWTEAEEALPD